MNPKRILIVDDETGFTRLLKLILEKKGVFQVQVENDGLQAVNTARKFKPDIIFLDVVMPNIDGGDVASLIKADPILTHVPIVFLTAIVSQKEANRQYSGEIGGFIFLAKPVNIDTMIECIEQHLGPCAKP